MELKQIREGFFVQDESMQADGVNQNEEDNQAQPMNPFFKKVKADNGGDCQMEESKEENPISEEALKIHKQLLGVLNLQEMPNSASFWM